MYRKTDKDIPDSYARKIRYKAWQTHRYFEMLGPRQLESPTSPCTHQGGCFHGGGQQLARVVLHTRKGPIFTLGR